MFTLNRDGFKQNDLELGRGVSGFFWPISKLNDDEDGNNDGRKNVRLFWLSITQKKKLYIYNKKWKIH